MRENILITTNLSIYSAMEQLQKTAQKCLIVIDKNKKLLGTITDGDIRRAILKKIKLSDKIQKIYRKQCFYLKGGKFDLVAVKKKMKRQIIDIVPIVDNKKRVIDYVQSSKLINQSYNENNNLEAIIMAGGEGTRLRPLTNFLPKPLIPIKDKTSIQLVIENFVNYGVKKFIISVNYKSKIIKSFFKEMKPSYKYKFLEEKKKLGTAGSLSFLKSKIKKNYFVINCDSIIKCDYNELYNFHKKNKNDITLVVSTKKFVIPYGICVVNKKGRLDSFREKPSKHYLINTGMYVINNQIFNLIPKNTYFDFNELIDKAKKSKKKIGLFPVSEISWSDVGQWDEIDKFYSKND